MNRPEGLKMASSAASAAPARLCCGLALAAACLAALLPAMSAAQTPVAAQVQDGVAEITAEALEWRPELARFRVHLQPDDGAASRPLLGAGVEGAEARLLRGWAAEGGVAGLAGVIYDNRDRGHSEIDRARFPQLTALRYGADIRRQNLDLGLAGPMLFPATVLGNSSTAVTGGTSPRSLPRLAMTSTDGPARAAQTALANHLYIYPAHRDFDGERDLMPANWAYFVATRGSSYSDQPFLDAFALTLAAFRPDTRAVMERGLLVVPTLQMIMRRSLAGINSDESYLSGWAHPVVFEGRDLRVERMMALARALTPETLPPQVVVRVVDEDFADAAGLLGLGERLYDTPSAIARLWRGWGARRMLHVAASALPRPGARAGQGGAQRFEWVLLRGDPGRVTILPQDAEGRSARIVIDWHERRPDGPRSQRQTDRVDIGVFAWNGHYWSAPAFVTVAFPGHQLREYQTGPDGAPRLVAVDHDAVSRGAAFDPVLHYAAPWRDTALYGPDGALAGWERRLADGGILRFDVNGRTADGRQLRHEETPGAGGSRILRMVLD